MRYYFKNYHDVAQNFTRGSYTLFVLYCLLIYNVVEKKMFYTPLPSSVSSLLALLVMHLDYNCKAIVWQHNDEVLIKTLEILSTVFTNKRKNSTYSFFFTKK